jgi:hypothetical protein
MLKTPRPLLLVATCISLTFAAAKAQYLSRNLPAEMDAALWLKADEKLELYARGNRTVVSSWQSKVGNLTANQSSSESARIEGNQTISNDKHAIFFPTGNATGGYGYFEIPSNFNLKNSTVLVSLKYEGSAFSPRVLSFLSNNASIAGADGISNDALALMHFSNVFRVESNYKTPTTPIYTSGNWSILSYRIDGNGNMTVALDGKDGTQFSNVEMAPQNTAGKTRIGMSGPKREPAFENLVNAHIYEILIFNKYLDSGNYTKAQTYMQQSMNASSVRIDPRPTASLINLGAAIDRPLSDSILTGGNASSNGTAVAGNFTWSSTNTTVTQSGNYSVIFEPTLAKYNVFEFEVPVTVVSVTPDDLRKFNSRNGTASSSQSISIRGGNLTSNATVPFDSGFEVSKDNSKFGSSVTLPVTSETASLYVRLAANQTSSGEKPQATLEISFGDRGDQYIPFSLKGRVFELGEPYIEVAPEVLTLPVTTAGTPSASANFTVTAYNLSGNLTANATAGLEISLENGTYAQTLEVPPAGGNFTISLNLRVAASASEGTLPGSVFLTSSNASATLTANRTVGQAPRTLPAPAAAAESSTPENSNTGKKIKKQKLKKKPKKKKKSVFTFPQVVATSGSTWITAGGNVVSEQDRAQSNTSK